MRIGAHLWIGKGLESCLELAVKLNCQCLQIFLHNPRQWQIKRRSDLELVNFRRELKKAKIFPLFVHMPYLLNLSSSEKRVRQLSLRRLSQELEEAETIGAFGYIIHPRNHQKISSGEETSLLAWALALFSDVKVIPLLENTATRGNWWSLWSPVKKSFSWVRFCLDTAHAWAAGYDLRSRDGFQLMLKDIEKNVGLRYISLIHANGSKVTCGSGLDRHESLNRGTFGLRIFQWLGSHKQLRNRPFIIETPRRGLAEDRENMALLRKIGEKHA
ncbi:MAG: deoxyribonuclease IV [Candidatus Omnitrophica bacterium]|nr:deoxyribonuclease IV [Candidatus Omnitrophota bacterium]